MNRHVRGERVYGERFDRIQTIREFSVLATRIMEDLYDHAGIDAQYSVHIRADIELYVMVGGLLDSFAYADTEELCYTPHGMELSQHIYEFVESYNWTNPVDPADRRFVHMVRLLTESEWRTVFWTPGEVRQLSEWPDGDEPWINPRGVIKSESLSDVD